MNCDLVIPLRSFVDPKTRLRAALDHSQRADLMQSLATNVIKAGQRTHEIDKIVLLSADTATYVFAVQHGIEFEFSDLDLNGALQRYRENNTEKNLIIGHADLGLIEDFSAFTRALDSHDVALSPDRHRLGTNVLAHRKTAHCAYEFGKRSYFRHRQGAMKNRLSCTSITDYRCTCDIDTLEDLDIFYQVKK